MSSLLNDVAARVGDVLRATFKDAGYDPKNAAINAHALVGIVTFVGQWWIEIRPDVDEVASHIENPKCRPEASVRVARGRALRLG